MVLEKIEVGRSGEEIGMKKICFERDVILSNWKINIGDFIYFSFIIYSL